MFTPKWKMPRKLLIYKAFILKSADRTGLEPATSAVTGRHSNQLNYRSFFRWGGKNRGLFFFAKIKKGFSQENFEREVQFPLRKAVSPQQGWQSKTSDFCDNWRIVRLLTLSRCYWIFNQAINLVYGNEFVASYNSMEILWKELF